MYTDLHKNDHQILFSHGYLAFHNIIVRDEHVSAIIDWEYAGWYPEYWDYYKTRSFLGGTDSDYRVCKRLYEKPYHPEYFLYIWFGMEILHGGF
jgi:Phosphotransferase enzyme family